MENYKNINGFEGMYQISDCGNVKSLARKVFSRYGQNRTMKDKLLSLNKDKATGYVSVTLSLGQKRITKSIHRLVANAFIPNPENKPEVNHKNGIQYDNNVSNLEWVTKSENCKHAYSKSLKREKKSWSKEEAKQLCKLAFKYHCDNPRTTSLPDKWIEENL